MITTVFHCGIDLDGTLLDGAERHKTVLFNAAAKFKITISDQQLHRYYALKCAGLTGIKALEALSIAQAATIAKQWTDWIEAEQFLVGDRLYPGVRQLLEEYVAKAWKFHLVTARQNKANVLQQIRLLGLEPLLASIEVISPFADGVNNPSKAMVSRKDQLQAIVGDTESDQHWAAELNIPFFALAWGGRSADYWRRQGLLPYADLAAALQAIERVVQPNSAV